MIPYEIFEKGCVRDVDDGLRAAQRIGFPVMIKASEGGGGKRIRKAKWICNLPEVNCWTLRTDGPMELRRQIPERDVTAENSICVWKS